FYQGDKGGPYWYTADKVFGSVDRIDNPTPIRSTIGPVFFTGHSIPRAGEFKLCTDEFLSGAVSIRKRCEIWFSCDFSIKVFDASHGQALYNIVVHQRPL